MVRTAVAVLSLGILLTVALAVDRVASTPPVQPEHIVAPIVPADIVTPAESVPPVEPEPAPVEVDPWKLVLVNPWNPLAEDFSVELVSLENGLQVDARIYDDLTAMLAACRAAGLDPVICSAYRTEETQTRLYNNKISRLQAAGYSQSEAETEAARWVAVPGTSEHHTGLALDLVSAAYQMLDEQQEQTPEQQWLMEHCWEYGFILRYSSEKSDITGIGYEPWHYRYVGLETAAAIRDQGVCLEEYLAAQTAVDPA